MKFGFGMATWIPYGTYNYERFHMTIGEFALAGYEGLECVQSFIYVNRALGIIGDWDKKVERYTDGGWF